MDKTDTPTKPSPRGTAKHVCCTDAPCDSGLRNQYFQGKRLTADSFQVEQSYLLERRRLLNRTIHGWGVVYGYAVKPAALASHEEGSGRLEIGPGLALDECGRELVHTGASTISVADVTLLDEKRARLERPPDGSYVPKGEPHQEHKKACWLLSVHYAEQQVGPVKVSDPCSCERHEWERVCETVRFSLRRVQCSECCEPFDCELQCGCGTGPCCEQHDEVHPYQGQDSKQGPDLKQLSEQSQEYHSSNGNPEPTPNPVRRGGCQCLCEYLMTGLSFKDCGGLRDVDDPCAHVRADLCRGVPLACVSLRESECEGEWLFGRWVEACGPRRLVKRNDALFDLIRGCDLTRISAIGWAGWHRSWKLIDWDEFEASFGSLPDSDVERIRRSRDKRETFPVVTLKYWVEFSRPVRKDTVLADCFSIRVLAREEEGAWAEPHRVPIVRVDTSAPPDTPHGLVTRATLVVDGRWLYDAVKGTSTIFDENPATLEIEIRGDLILDCNGQAIDANAHGLLPAPSGNGTPGGTFFSSFRVQPRYGEYRIADETADRTGGVEP